MEIIGKHPDGYILKATRREIDKITGEGGHLYCEVGDLVRVESLTPFIKTKGAVAQEGNDANTSTNKIIG